MGADVFGPMGPLSFGWNTLMSNKRFFIILMIIAGVLYNLPNLMGIALLSALGAIAQDSLLNSAVSIIGLLIYMLLEVGLLKIALSFRDGRRPEVMDLFRSYPLFLKYLVAGFFYGLMVFVGLMLLVVPGVYLAIKYQFFGYLIVDRGLGPVEALKESGRMTAGAMSDLFFFGLSLIGIGLAAIVMIFLIIAIPAALVSGSLSSDLLVPLSFVGAIIFAIVDHFVIGPLAKLATADVYRILEAHQAAMLEANSVV